MLKPLERISNGIDEGAVFRQYTMRYARGRVPYWHFLFALDDQGTFLLKFLFKSVEIGVEI